MEEQGNKISEVDLKSEISSLRGLLMSVTDQISKTNIAAGSAASPVPSKDHRKSVEFRHLKSELDTLKVSIPPSFNM